MLGASGTGSRVVAGTRAVIRAERLPGPVSTQRRSGASHLERRANTGHRLAYGSGGTQVTNEFLLEANGASVAQKIQTLFIDDLDGSEAEGTVRFGLDGTDYEIDLNTEHAQALRDALQRYKKAARRAGGGARRPGRSGRKAPADGLSTTEVREGQSAGH